MVSTCNVAVNLNSTCGVNVDVFVEVNGDRRWPPAYPNLFWSTL